MSTMEMLDGVAIAEDVCVNECDRSVDVVVEAYVACVRGEAVHHDQGGQAGMNLTIVDWVADVGTPPIRSESTAARSWGRIHRRSWRATGFQSTATAPRVGRWLIRSNSGPKTNLHYWCALHDSRERS